jgi:hypothetical protein
MLADQFSAPRGHCARRIRGILPLNQRIMTNAPEITVLTDPVPVGYRRVTERAKGLGRSVKRWISPPPPYVNTKFRGHFAVTRSLVEGLEKAGVRFSYNPKTLHEVADVVVVLSGVDALRQAIGWRRTGKIRRLLAGPNIMVFPSEHGRLICCEEVDACITPDQLTGAMYEQECQELKGRCKAWPAGVDTEYWRPDMAKERRDQVLMFEKTSKGPVGPIQPYVHALEARGHDVHVMRYGSFVASEYRRALHSSKLMVGFVQSESQGIAWAEAWAADVPTLIWRQDEYTYRHRTWMASTAPYLSSDTGRFFGGLEEFELVVDAWEHGQEHFRPREWVLENMSDEMCARQLCAFAGIR